MIILRYVPHDEAGYLNYFKEFNNPDNSFATFIKYFIWVSMGLIPIIIIMIKNNNSIFMPTDVAIPLLMKILCYLLSLVLLFNLMNIVMSFRTNTKPILKTKSLSWSLQKSFKKLYADFTEGEKVVLEAGIKDEWDIFIALKDTVIASGTATSEQKISYIINIFIAFNELAKITLKGFTINEKDINSNYIKDLKNTIKDNNIKLIAVAASTIATKVSNVALIYDKTVKIPATYNYTNEDLEKKQYLDEHTTNSNDNNTDYIYTADISYDSPNLFYEKYWDVNFGSMWKYDYFVPTILFGGYKPNLYTILMMIVQVIICIFIIHGIAMFAKTEGIDYSLLYTILQPLIMLVFLIGFILLFINFNTWFNKYVVYMCLDSSYKRSLNKLNNIVTPYIRMYDNKIIRGNKTYIRHYIIANVFYSILSGNIKLNDGGDLNPTSEQSSAITNRGKITAAYDAAKNAEIKLNPDSSPLAPIDEDTKKTKEAKEAKYYDISRIKENRLKFANMNNSILSNDNEYREYYKGLYDNIYQGTYTETQAEKLYKVFKDIFTKPDGAANNITAEAGIDAYFKNHIITKDAVAKKEGTIDKIYLIIKKCIDLFDEEKFNNNLIYYNNPENKQKGIDIDSYAKFKFYKYGDNVIPYKFILNLNTTTEYDNFVKDIKTVAMTDFNKYTDSTDITKILEENDEEDLLSQASDIEKKQDKNLIKIIAKYLLILGHINYNRIEYNYPSSDATKKQEIYEKKSYYLYRLFSNILYDDTYDINDTFKTSPAPTLLITNAKYYNLTYIYNYLETKYVVISPNSNKNYLINIIKSINNKINDDDKTMNTDAKNARYLFREKINNKNNPEEYDNEEDILTIANNISTSSFIATYVCNIVVLTLYFIIISLNIKKSF
jgi:hypothetical protein